MRIAIFGCGSIGQRHIRNLITLGERDLLMYDTNGLLALDLPQAYAVNRTTCLDDVWSWRPEMVLVCTPPDSHTVYANQAIRHGCHVFIEKPLALDNPPPLLYEDHPLTFVACNWRWHPALVEIKRLLSEDTIGEILLAGFASGYYLPTVRPNYATSYVATTGATLELGSHIVDLATWLLGPARLYAAGTISAKSIGLPNVDGACQIMLRHDSGVMAGVTVSLLQTFRSQLIAFNGTKGALSCIWGEDGTWQLGYQRLQDGIHFRDSVATNTNAMYLAELRHFLDCIREDKSTCNPVNEAAKVQAILVEARKQGRVDYCES